MNEKGYLSQTIDLEQLLLNLEKEKRILFDVPAGYGKTTFILKDLRNAYKGKILFLVSRSLLKEQLEKKIKEYNTQGISIKTYQSLQRELFAAEYLDLTQYELIVCDECHYFISDSPFSDNTDILLERIISKGNKVIFLSATPQDFNLNNWTESINNLRYLLKDDYDYRKDQFAMAYHTTRNYSEIEKIIFYTNGNHAKKVMRDIMERGEKAIIFIEEKKIGKALFEEFADNSLFIVSESSASEYTKLMDIEKRDAMIENEMFDCNFLITTKVLDVGINLCDRAIKHIFIDSLDIPNIIQSLGRKRIQDKNDRYTLHLKTHQHELTTKHNKIELQLQPAYYYLDMIEYHRHQETNDIKGKATARRKAYFDFCGKYHRFTDALKIINYKYCEIDFNYCIYLKYRAELKTLERMLKPIEEYKHEYKDITTNDLSVIWSGEEFVLLQELNLIKNNNQLDFRYNRYSDDTFTTYSLSDIVIEHDYKIKDILDILKASIKNNAYIDKENLRTAIQTFWSDKKSNPPTTIKTINKMLADNEKNIELYIVDGRKDSKTQTEWKARYKNVTLTDAEPDGTTAE